jgi:hypothetical protein
MFIFHTEIPRADFVLAFLQLFIEHLNIDRNLFFAGENFKFFQHLEALSLQTQQGHFHPWPF